MIIETEKNTQLKAAAELEIVINIYGIKLNHEFDVNKREAT